MTAPGTRGAAVTDPCCETFARALWQAWWARSVTVGSLFSGIGGLEMGLEACGIGPVLWQCDSDPYARAVLAEHWPDVRRYNDVKEIDANAARVDLVCGGFPCQPHSLAGKRRGMSDARWLWPEFARIIADVRPSAVFIENVPGLRTSGLSTVLADLAALGFDAEWGCFSAAEVGAPHRRIRLFVLAHANGDAGDAWRPSYAVEGTDGRDVDRGGLRANVAHASGPRLAEREEQPDRNELAPAERDGSRRHAWSAEPDVGRVANGVPARAHRLRLLGNAVVPQQAAYAFQALASRSTPELPTATKGPR